MDKQDFGSLFTVGEVINSGGPPHWANAARLEILAIEDKGVRYKSLRSKQAKRLDYNTLALIVRQFDRIDPRAIQRTIQPVYIEAGLKVNLFTENYEYAFAREVRQRRKLTVTLHLDSEVLDWLRSKGEGDLTRINDILHNLMEAERRLDQPLAKFTNREDDLT